MLKLQKELDEAANNWNRTKDSKYKDLWYKLIKEFADGTYYPKRRTISISSCHKNSNGEYLIIGRSQLHGPVRDTETKVKRIR